MPVSVSLLIVNGIALWRALSTIATPLKRLATQAEFSQLGKENRRGSKTAEEQTIREYIETRIENGARAQQTIEELERNLVKIKDRLDQYVAQNADLETRLGEHAQLERELRHKNEQGAAAHKALECALELERKSKVGVEVQMRTDEIYAQMERAIAATAFKTVWIPSIVQELKAPIAAINEISKRLKDSWNQTSFTQVNEEIEQICRQSQAQIDLLEDILSRRPESHDVEEATPVPVDPRIEYPSHENALSPRVEEEESEAIIIPSPVLVEEKLEIIIDNPIIDLKALLFRLATEYASSSAPIEVDVAVDPDLDVEIEDDSLQGLLSDLMDIAVAHLEEGKVSLGATLHEDHLDFDVACNGVPRKHGELDLSQANRIAQAISGRVEVDMPNASELHMSFRYDFDQIERAAN